MRMENIKKKAKAALEKVVMKIRKLHAEGLLSGDLQLLRRIEGSEEWLD